MPFRWPRSVINMPDGSVMTPGFRVIRPARRRRGLGDWTYTQGDVNGVCPAGSVMAGSPPHCTLTRFVDLNMPDVKMIGQCPVQDLSRNLCMLSNGNQIGCNALRECDSLTGATHFEYGLPGGPTGNVNMPVMPEGTPIAPATNAPILGTPPGMAQTGPVTYSVLTPAKPFPTMDFGVNQPSYMPASSQPATRTVVSSSGVPSSSVPTGGQSNAPGPVYAGGSPGGPISNQYYASPYGGASNNAGPTVVVMPGQPGGGFDLSAIPLWVWIAAGVGAVMLFKK